MFTNVVNLSDMHYCFSEVMYAQWLCTDLHMQTADQHTLAADQIGCGRTVGVAAKPWLRR